MDQQPQSPARQSSFDLWVGRAVAVTKALGTLAVFLLMVHVIADVTLRYLFNRPIPGTIEMVSNWWMPLVTFLGLAYAQQRREHIEVTLLVDRLPPPLRASIGIATSTFALVVALLILWFGWTMALTQLEEREVALGAVSIAVWPIRFVVPLGALVFALQLVIDLRKEIAGLRGRGRQ